MNERLSRWSFAGLLIMHRSLGWGLFGGGLLYLLLKHLGLPYRCPFRMVTGLSCPGCGMTRASMALLRGEWKEAFTYHAFIGVFVVFWSVVGLGLILPKRFSEGYLSKVNLFESRTRWGLWFGLLLIFYTLIRWY